jgi:hypothetical protein
MDYKMATFGAPPSVLLGNAVFLTWHDPVRVLDYREFAAQGTAMPGPANVMAILSDEGSKRGRKFTITTAPSAAGVPASLASGDFDVLLIEHQRSAPPGVLGATGASWAAAINEFGGKGGVVVALATDGGAGGMDALLTNAGLLAVEGLSSVDGEVLENQGMLDAIGVNVLSPFIAKHDSAALTTSEVPGPRLDYVIVTDQGAPVVIHKLIIAE